MLSLCLAPKPSRWCAACLLGLHAALLWVLLLQWSGWQQMVALLAWLLSAVYSYKKWQRSADYVLEISSSGTVSLRWQTHETLKVERVKGGMVSRCVLVTVWQDVQQQRYQTVLWPDSVGKREFKMAYVWLRWQPVPQKQKKEQQ